MGGKEAALISAVNTFKRVQRENCDAVQAAKEINQFLRPDEPIASRGKDSGSESAVHVSGARLER